MINLKSISIVNPIAAMRPFGNHFNKQYASIEILKKINAQDSIQSIDAIKSRISTLAKIHTTLQLSGAMNA